MWLSGFAKRVVWYTSRLYSPYIQSGTAQLPPAMRKDVTAKCGACTGNGQNGDIRRKKNT
jgi:hypothetical protein